MENEELPLVITKRELAEFHFALDYNERYNHGTDGHNRLNLLAKVARHLGLVRGDHSVPATIRVDDGPATGAQKAS